MPRTARPRPNSRPTRPQLDTPKLLDAAESVGEEFAEATEHVLPRTAFAGLYLGPLVEIPPEELIPGALGWRRTVRATPGERASADARAHAAEIGCVVVPSPPGRARPIVPFRDDDPGDRVVLEAGPAWPRRVLYLRAGAGVTRVVLRRFASAVVRELAEDEGLPRL
jgi:hypothetical protein